MTSCVLCLVHSYTLQYIKLNIFIKKTLIPPFPCRVLSGGERRLKLIIAISHMRHVQITLPALNSLTFKHGMSQFCVWRNYYRRDAQGKKTLKYLEQTALLWLHSTIIIIKAFSRAVYHPHSPEIVIIKYFAVAVAVVDVKCERQKIIFFDCVY